MCESLRLQAQGEMKFDPKKSFWVPDPEEGFVGGQITADSGATVTVTLDAGGEVRSLSILFSRNICEVL